MPQIATKCNKPNGPRPKKHSALRIKESTVHVRYTVGESDPIVGAARNMGRYENVVADKNQTSKAIHTKKLMAQQAKDTILVQ